MQATKAPKVKAETKKNHDETSEAPLVKAEKKKRAEAGRAPLESKALKERKTQEAPVDAGKEEVHHSSRPSKWPSPSGWWQRRGQPPLLHVIFTSIDVPCCVFKALADGMEKQRNKEETLDDDMEKEQHKEEALDDGMEKGQDKDEELDDAMEMEPEKEEALDAGMEKEPHASYHQHVHG
eukprot:6117013-Amphidinium_carterae.1